MHSLLRPTGRTDLLVGWDYTQSRRTASVSAPGSRGGFGVDGALRENRGAEVKRRAQAMAL